MKIRNLNSQTVWMLLAAPELLKLTPVKTIHEYILENQIGKNCWSIFCLLLSSVYYIS